MAFMLVLVEEVMPLARNGVGAFDLVFATG